MIDKNRGFFNELDDHFLGWHYGKGLFAIPDMERIIYQLLPHCDIVPSSSPSSGYID
jgi:hypothetical protein